MPSNVDIGYVITVGGVQETITSIAALEARVKELSVAWKTCTTTVQAQTVALTDYRNAQATLVTALAPATKSMQGLTSTSANAGMALLNLNYVIRDSPYFFNNFAMGVLAVGNNLNPLIDTFARTRKEAALLSATTGKTVTTFGLLKQAMVGGAGISIAFSLIVTLIQSFVFWQAKAKKATDETNESLKTQYDKLQDLGRAGLIKSKVEALAEIRRIEDEMLRRLSPEGREATLEYRGREESLRIMFEAPKNAADREKLLLLQEQAKYIDVLLTGTTSLRKIENEISALKLRQKDETKAQSLETQKSIDFLEKMKDSFTGVVSKAEKLKETFGATPPLIRQIVDAMSELNKQMALLGLGGGVPGTGGGGLRPGGLRGRPVNPIMQTLEQIQKDLKEEFAPTLKMITQVANTAGNAISNAFLSGKNVIDAATQALIQFITQLLVVQTLMGILTAIFVPGGTFLGGFLGFLGNYAQGGIIPKAAGGMIVGGNFPSGDRMLVAANSGEMILNASQQSKLFNMINNGSRQQVEITGKIEARQDKFVIDFKKAESKLRGLQT